MKAENLVAIVAASAACHTSHAFQSHFYHRKTPLSSMLAPSLFVKKDENERGGSGKGFGAPSTSCDCSDLSDDGKPLGASTPDTAVVPPSTSTRIVEEVEGRDSYGCEAAAGGKERGDALRGSTGVRPSLHPTAVNCVAEALRSRSTLGRTHDENGAEIDASDASLEPVFGGGDESSPVTPLQIALAAAGIAMAAIDKRKAAAETDDTTDAFTTEEAQVISGRVVGVVMRLRDLERTLVERVARADWVVKYGEEGSFGVLKEECRLLAGEGANADVEATEAVEKQLVEALKSNPLLRMNRAECLLGLFLEGVERPRLEAMEEEVPNGSAADFIDAERCEVLLLG